MPGYRIAIAMNNEHLQHYYYYKYIYILVYYDYWPLKE